MMNKVLWDLVYFVMLGLILLLLIFNIFIIYPIYALVEFIYYKKNMNKVIVAFCLKMKEQGITSFEFSSTASSKRIFVLNDRAVDFNYKRSEKIEDYKNKRFHFLLETKFKGETGNVFFMENNVKQVAIENFLNEEKL